MELRFADPGWLRLLWVLPVLWGLVLLAARRRARLAALLCAVPPRVGRGRAVADLLALLAAAALVVALARPQAAAGEAELAGVGANVVFVVDVSASMGVSDLAPDRLAVARAVALKLLDALGGNAFGLVAFSGTSFAQCPVTLDGAAVALFVRALSVDYLPVPGTVLADAVRRALRILPEGEPGVIVVLSDGEDHGGGLEEVVQEARRRGVVCCGLVCGTARGGYVPDGRGGIKKDAQGNPVVSKADPGPLEQLAVGTGGVVSDVRAPSAVAQIAQVVRREGTGRLRGRRIYDWRDIYWAPALAAALCLIARSWISV